MTNEQIVHALIAAFCFLLTALLGIVGYFVKNLHQRVEKHIESSDERSGEHAEKITRLQEQQAGTKGWLEAIDERMRDGFKEIAQKLDRLTERRP